MFLRKPGGSSASRLARGLLGAAILLYVLQATLYLTWFIDDSAISFTYARNLAGGHGLVLFPGGERVEAYSNPLWVFLLSPFVFLGISPFVMAKILSLLLGIGALIGVTRLGDRLARLGATPEGSPDASLEASPPILPLGARSGIPVGALAALLVAFNPPFVIWTNSGLEGGLYVFLLVWATERLSRELTAPVGDALRPWSALFYFLAAITRPEGILYFGVAGLLRLFWDREGLLQRRGPTYARWGAWLAMFFGPWLLYQAWHYHYFAAFVTNTYHVKQPEAPFLERLFNHNSSGWNYIFNWFSQYRVLYLAPLALLPLLDRSAGQARARAWALPLIMAAAALFFILYADYDWMREYRFMAPVAPFFFLVMVAGVTTLLDRLPDWAIEAPARPSLTALGLCALGLSLVTPCFIYALEFASRPEVSVDDVRARSDYFKHARELLGLTGDVVYMDPDLGATSYYSGMRVVDTWGLADVPFALHPWNQSFVANYVFNEVRPQFAHIYGYWESRVKILEEPRWNTEFVGIPPYRSRSGAMDGGNYVSRNLLRATRLEYPSNLEPQRRFESGLELVHAALDVRAVPAGGKTRLTLFWRITQPYVKEALFITRLQNPELPPLNLDHLPVHGWLPPSRWLQGEVVKDSIEVNVPKGTPPGAYSLWVQITNPRDGAEDRLLPQSPNQPQNPVLIVGTDSAKAEVAALSSQAEALLAGGRLEEASKTARRAASIFPEDEAPQALLKKCDAAWRDEVLASTERLMNESARQASETYRPAYWRWPGDAKVLEVGRRLGADAMIKAQALDSQDAFALAFEHYQAAIILDPRLSKARQRAEAVRLRRDSPKGVPGGQEDREWAKGVVLGAGDKGGLVSVRSEFKKGEQVVCQIYWANPAWHKTEWIWFDPNGLERFQQSQPTGENTPLSYAFIDIPPEEGAWTVEVRVNGKPIGTRRFTVQD